MQSPDLALADEEKVFYDRFWALHRNPLLVEVYKRFGIGVFRRSSVLELAHFLDGRQFGGDRCVEIGTFKGLTSLLLARRFKQVVSIDIYHDDDRMRVAQAVGVDNVRFVTVADNAEKARVISGLTFDGAYVDGDHAKDTYTDFDLVKRSGQVLFHEYWPAQPAVMKLCEELKASGTVDVDRKMALWTAKQNG
jgi:hypothetical protein